MKLELKDSRDGQVLLRAWLLIRDPDPFFRQYQLFFLKPIKIGEWLFAAKQILINLKVQFCCSRNVENFHRIHLRLISVSFLCFSVGS